ncbi:unnamed protein product [Amoebophrya sp. A120]|nr:unnamed protein product [Amoebophrya sp. A120]|eukprot:GSA120T00022939001.1
MAETPGPAEDEVAERQRQPVGLRLPMPDLTVWLAEPRFNHKAFYTLAEDLLRFENGRDIRKYLEIYCREFDELVEATQPEAIAGSGKTKAEIKDFWPFGYMSLPNKRLPRTPHEDGLSLYYDWEGRSDGLGFFLLQVLLGCASEEAYLAVCEFLVQERGGSAADFIGLFFSVPAVDHLGWTRGPNVALRKHLEDGHGHNGNKLARHTLTLPAILCCRGWLKVLQSNIVEHVLDAMDSLPLFEIAMRHEQEEVLKFLQDRFPDEFLKFCDEYLEETSIKLHLDERDLPDWFHQEILQATDRELALLQKVKLTQAAHEEQVPQGDRAASKTSTTADEGTGIVRDGRNKEPSGSSSGRLGEVPLDRGQLTPKVMHPHQRELGFFLRRKLRLQSKILDYYYPSVDLRIDLTEVVTGGDESWPVGFYRLYGLPGALPFLWEKAERFRCYNATAGRFETITFPTSQLGGAAGHWNSVTCTERPQHFPFGAAAESSSS